MEREEIVKKLKEKGIITWESDMWHFRDIDLKKILQSGLLEKYDSEILRECLMLKDNGSLRRTRFYQGMSIEDMEIYCQIKQANPDLNIKERDPDLYSIDKKNLEKYSPKDLGFIIDKLNIIAYRNSEEKELFYRYNINERQLEKLKRIAEQYPDVKFEILDELFEIEEFWDLDDETFKDISASEKYYVDGRKQQEYLKNIIIDGKLDEWFKLKKEKDFLPNSTIFFDKNLTERFNYRRNTNFIHY